MQLPVLSLEYEYRAYIKLGRKEKAELIRKFLQNRNGGDIMSCGGCGGKKKGGKKK